MTNNNAFPLSLMARNYLMVLLGTYTDADQNELKEVIIYLNNLITLDELNDQKNP